MDSIAATGRTTTESEGETREVERPAPGKETGAVREPANARAVEWSAPIGESKQTAGVPFEFNGSKPRPAGGHSGVADGLLTQETPRLDGRGSRSRQDRKKGVRSAAPVNRRQSGTALSTRLFTRLSRHGYRRSVPLVHRPRRPRGALAVEALRRAPRSRSRRGDEGGGGNLGALRGRPVAGALQGRDPGQASQVRTRGLADTPPRARRGIPRDRARRLAVATPPDPARAESLLSEDSPPSPERFLSVPFSLARSRPCPRSSSPVPLSHARPSSFAPPGTTSSGSCTATS